MLPKGPPADEPVHACPDCPICGGTFEVVYNRNNQRVSICRDCQAGLTIPATAWEVQRHKREKKLDT